MRQRDSSGEDSYSKQPETKRPFNSFGQATSNVASKTPGMSIRQLHDDSDYVSSGAGIPIRFVGEASSTLPDCPSPVKIKLPRREVDH